MKKKLLLIFAATTLTFSCGETGGGTTDPTTDPDPNTEPIIFKSESLKETLIAEGVDSNKDGEITHYEANAVRIITISNNKEISTLDDIVNFTSLEEIYASNTNLTTINIASNTGIKKLDISHTAVENIDISSNKTLEYLNVSGSSIKDLDIKNNTKLKTLELADTSIKKLDVSNNLDLKELDTTGSSLEVIIIDSDKQASNDWEINDSVTIIDKDSSIDSVTPALPDLDEDDLSTPDNNTTTGNSDLKDLEEEKL